ncbi:hypothetical protein AA0472_0879 [Acetobacter estunensis NRIC 0472]|nr:hypothetical protein AA0472_0879 [Acetobacter estunensis NRIC 0472]
MPTGSRPIAPAYVQTQAGSWPQACEKVLAWVQEPPLSSQSPPAVHAMLFRFRWLTIFRANGEGG